MTVKNQKNRSKDKRLDATKNEAEDTIEEKKMKMFKVEKRNCCAE